MLYLAVAAATTKRSNCPIMTEDDYRGAPATVNSPARIGLLSPEQPVGIWRVEGVKKLGLRVGNWLLSNEVRRVVRIVG
jgi:hypothetical protein